MNPKTKHTAANLPFISPKVWWKAVASFLFFISSSQLFTLLILLPPPPAERERRRLYKLLLWWYAGLIVRTHANIRTRIINEPGEDFSKPGIMIANHQSIFDVTSTLMLSHKILIVTNDWAHQPFFHFFIGKYIDFFSVNKGLENYVDDFKKWIDRGYLILIFPEGVRWGTGKIERFHKGAFYLAEKLEVDILPLLLHGTGTINSSRQFYLKEGWFHVKVLPRIKPDDTRYGATYQERTKRVREWYKQEYQAMNSVNPS
jgi:1-acyl-sn-glycerol-3-phosphate acyltransferase